MPDLWQRFVFTLVCEHQARSRGLHAGQDRRYQLFAQRPGERELSPRKIIEIHTAEGTGWRQALCLRERALVQTPEGVRYLEGDYLLPYKVPNSGLCWWCGSTADSREHKFKRTDLTRMWGNEDHLVWICQQEQVKIRSARKSSIVKFTASMCASCNNSRSQSFDVAYDKFADYVWDNLGNLWNHRFLDMKRIYGGDWQESSLNLARYFAKQLACRMADDGFPVPSVISSFLNGQRVLSNVQMALFKDRELWNFYCQGKSEGSPTAGLFLSPAMSAVSKSRRELVMFSSSAIIGYIGVMYRWDDKVAGTDPFHVYRKARLHLREDLPEI